MTAMVKGDTDPIWQRRLRRKPRSKKSAPVLKLLKGFEQSQWWDPEDIEARQFRQMARLLAHAQGSISHYAEALGHVNPDDVESLKAGRWFDLPVLKRDTVNKLGEDLLSRTIPKSHGRLNPIYTSGTTGRPIRVVRTLFALNYWSAFTARDHIWHNRNIKGKLAAIRSSAKDVALYPKGARQIAWGSRDGVFKTGPSISLNLNTSIPDMAEWIARNEPDHLLSMSNIIKRLAPYCIENGITFQNLREVQVIGEECGELLRQQCREAWDVPLHDNYTSREIGYMALQCPRHDHYHIQSEGVFLEILDEDDQPCEPGEIGRVIQHQIQVIGLEPAIDVFGFGKNAADAGIAFRLQKPRFQVLVENNIEADKLGWKTGRRTQARLLFENAGGANGAAKLADEIKHTLFNGFQLGRIEDIECEHVPKAEDVAFYGRQGEVFGFLARCQQIRDVNGRLAEIIRSQRKRPRRDKDHPIVPQPYVQGIGLVDDQKNPEVEFSPFQKKRLRNIALGNHPRGPGVFDRTFHHPRRLTPGKIAGFEDPV